MEKPANWNEWINDVNRSFGLELAERLSAEEVETCLAEKLNEMTKNDFNGLVNLLYRIDIDEARLKQSLKKNPGEDAGKIMARMIMERQWQKIQTRRQFGR
jgi:hypothetical protein